MCIRDSDSGMWIFIESEGGRGAIGRCVSGEGGVADMYGNPAVSEGGKIKKDFAERRK